jgi:hypothetical protein
MRGYFVIQLGKVEKVSSTGAMQSSFCGIKIQLLDKSLEYVLIMMYRMYLTRFKHMNIDHVCAMFSKFRLTNVVDQFAYVGPRDLQHPKDEDERFNKKKKDLFQLLMRSFARLEEPSQLDLNEYSVIHASPSVVPNPYLPTLRLWGYNVSDLDVRLSPAHGNNAGQLKKGVKPRHGRPSKTRCKRREDKFKWWCQLPERPWYSDENAPSRKNGPLTPLGYVQVRGTCCF